jgi:protein-S-isoprenylcysteine O-methyltransferase Ste14
MTTITQPDPQSSNRPDSSRATARWLLSVTLVGVILAAGLFLAAGQLRWPMGWAYVLIFAATQALIAVFVIRDNPQLAAERAQTETSDVAPWDRPLAGIVGLFGPLATLIVAGLDQRFGWSMVTPALQMVALALVVLSALFTVWAMACNRFFYGRVRIEKERGHTVADTGPYRLVRHPGYLGAIITDGFTALLLDSWWALLPASLTMAVIVLRTALEDRTLLQELEGYREYARVVRYRLFPGVW